MTFTPEVYAEIREGARRSAAVIVPLLVEAVLTRSVLDVGCGEGWFAREFALRYPSMVITAVDQTVEAREETEGLTFLPFDLVTGSFAALPTADLAVCLEVAEHLPADAAEGLIAGLCSRAPAVAFSAAIPGQGGHHHLNERWPAYWSALFERQGFTLTDPFRWTLWDDDRVEPWYRQNLLLATRGRTDTVPRSLVHPVIWEHRRERLYGCPEL